MKSYEMSTDQPLNPGCAVLGCSLYKRLTAMMLCQVCECAATKALHVPSMLCVPLASADSDKSSPPQALFLLYNVCDYASIGSP